MSNGDGPAKRHLSVDWFHRISPYKSHKAFRPPPVPVRPDPGVHGRAPVTEGAADTCAETPDAISAAKAAGSGWLAGNPKDYDRTLILPVAPLGEQSDILVKAREEFAPLTTAITHPERKIALLREYRTRLVADVVTGKLDVRPAARHLPAEPLAPGPSPVADSLDDVGDLEETPTEDI
jgi:hypothetical protein